MMLIDRTAKKIQLTDAGEVVLAEGQRILDSLDDLSLHQYDLMNLKKGFNQLYPDIKIKISQDESEKVRQDINDGTLNLGIVTLNYFPS